MNVIKKSFLIVATVGTIAGTTYAMDNPEKAEADSTCESAHREVTKQAVLGGIRTLVQEWEHNIYDNCPKESHSVRTKPPVDNDNPNKIRHLLSWARENGILFTDEDVQPLRFTQKTHHGPSYDLVTHYHKEQLFWLLRNATDMIQKGLFDELLQHNISVDKENATNLKPIAIVAKRMESVYIVNANTDQIDVLLAMLASLRAASSNPKKIDSNQDNNAACASSNSDSDGESSDSESSETEDSEAGQGDDQPGAHAEEDTDEPNDMNALSANEDFELIDHDSD